MLTAYAIDARGVYEDVTARAAWTTSDPTVVRVTASTPGRVFAVAPGAAEVSATYEGFSSTVPAFVEAIPALLPVPRLTMSGPGPMQVGDSGNAGASWWATNIASQTVTRAAVWTSSDPAVATVEGGLVRALAPGNAEIRVFYDGHTAFYWLSVNPFSIRPELP
jgi:uncharacterized protein YjdB